MDKFSEEYIEQFGMEILNSIKPLNQELIEKHIGPRGGIYTEKSRDYLMFKVLGASLMRGYQEIKTIKPLPKVFFEISDNASLNATAIITNKEDLFLILLNKGLIQEIDLFIDSFTKSKHNEYQEEYLKNRNWLRGLFHQIIMEHELSHIFNGHLGLISEIYNNQTIEEQRDESKQQEFKFLLQTLEMDADCTALARLYGWLMNISKNLHKIKDNPLVTEFAGKPIQSFSDLIMAFYAINKFFYDLTSLSNDIGKSTHPTPRERVVGSFGNVLLTIKTLGYEINPKDLMEEILKKIIWVEKIFEEDYGIPINKEMWNNSEYFNNIEVTLKILHNWVNIQPSLLKHNYIPIVGIERDLKIDDWFSSFEKTEKNKNET